MTSTLDPVTRNHVRQAAEALTTEFSGIFSLETIERYISESLELLGSARINVFVPVLAHRFARERLKALGQADGMLVKEQPAGNDNEHGQRQSQWEFAELRFHI